MPWTFTDSTGRAGSRPFWAGAIRLAVILSIGLALLAMAFVAFVFVLPLVLIGGIALHFYLRRKLRQARRASSNVEISTEYTVIERR